jgi:hypothetical protein
MRPRARPSRAKPTRGATQARISMSMVQPRIVLAASMSSVLKRL